MWLEVGANQALNFGQGSDHAAPIMWAGVNEILKHQALSPTRQEEWRLYIDNTW